MEKLFSEILGTPVVAENIGRPVGRVFNLLIHPDNGQVLALSLDLLFHRLIVPMDIHGWYREIVIARSDVIVSPEDVVRVREILNRETFFFKNRVFTKEGKYLGRVFDYAIDIDQMFLTKIFVAKNILGLVRLNQCTIPFHNILEVQQKKIVVKNDLAREKVRKRALEYAS